MPLPSPRSNVPRGEVHMAVKAMLLNPDVGNVDCVEQADGNYSVTPHAKGA